MQLFLKLFLFASFSCCITQASAASANFASATQAKKMANAAGVVITEIGWMRITPKVLNEHDWQKSSKALTTDDKSEILKIISATKRMAKAPAPARCVFAPGFQITFLDAKKQPIDAVLICLNCDVLAIGANPRPVKRGVFANTKRLRYGEAIEQRADLIALVNRYFTVDIK